jgi:hypothetical protein
MPSPVQHATLPLVGKSKGLSAARGPLREKGVAVNDDAKLPLAWPGHDRATCVVVQAPHHPQCADVARYVLACGCWYAHSLPLSVRYPKIPHAHDVDVNIRSQSSDAGRLVKGSGLATAVPWVEGIGNRSLDGGYAAMVHGDEPFRAVQVLEAQFPGIWKRTDGNERQRKIRRPERRLDSAGNLMACHETNDASGGA